MRRCDDERDEEKQADPDADGPLAAPAGEGHEHHEEESPEDQKHAAQWSGLRLQAPVSGRWREVPPVRQEPPVGNRNRSDGSGEAEGSALDDRGDERDPGQRSSVNRQAPGVGRGNGAERERDRRKKHRGNRSAALEPSGGEAEEEERKRNRHHVGVEIREEKAPKRKFVDRVANDS